tara:strand:+ start:61 stop:1611 length:1551 start_codon:yes stop_codon:yes gene_type:complete
MAIDFFGFKFGKKNETDLVQNSNKSFVEPDTYDGAQTIEESAAGGFYGQYVDFIGSAKTENDLTHKYRAMSLYPECDQAIEDIVNDAIILGSNNKVVDINLDHSKLSDNIKEKVSQEFDNILTLLNFNNKGYEIFKRWYIDGKLYYHIILHGDEKDEKSVRKGISEIRAVDPVKIRKVRKIQKEQIRDKDNRTTIPLVKNVEEFFLFTDTTPNTITPTQSSGIKIAKDAICYVTSGQVDSNTKRVVGYLHKAIRPLNMLRQIEDAVVIYRISRAPERRVFYIDVGNLPKQKAEQYLRDIMNRYRNKLVYNASTGEIRDDRKHMSMLEDFWIPRREGGRSTEITTLDGGQNLGEMEDVIYLQRKLFRALNVPLSRLETEAGFNLGRSTEITRDEIKFGKFVSRLRARFSTLFNNLLKVQLISKGIISENDWKALDQQLKYTFQTDSHFTDLKDMEILKEKMDVMRELQEYVGTYFSKEYIKKNILRFSEEELREMESQIEKEAQAEPQEQEDDLGEI